MRSRTTNTKPPWILTVTNGETQKITQIAPASSKKEATLESQFEPRTESTGYKRKASFTITMFLSVHGLMNRSNPLQPKYIDFISMTQFGFGTTLTNLTLQKYLMKK